MAKVTITFTVPEEMYKDMLAHNDVDWDAFAEQAIATELQKHIGKT